MAADGGPNVVETMLFWQPDTKHICTWIRLLSLYRPAMHCSWATWKHHCQCSTSHIRSNKIQIIIIYITFIYLLCMSTKSNYVTWLKIKVLRSHLSFIILLNLTQMIWTQQLHTPWLPPACALSPVPALFSDLWMLYFYDIWIIWMLIQFTKL